MIFRVIIRIILRTFYVQDAQDNLEIKLTKDIIETLLKSTSINPDAIHNVVRILRIIIVYDE